MSQNDYVEYVAPFDESPCEHSSLYVSDPDLYGELPDIICFQCDARWYFNDQLFSYERVREQM